MTYKPTLGSTEIGVDAPRVTEADAQRFFVHHLALAAMYFEAIPENRDRIKEMLAIQTHDGAAIAGLAFYDSLEAHYKETD